MKCVICNTPGHPIRGVVVCTNHLTLEWEANMNRKFLASLKLTRMKWMEEGVT